MNSIIIATDFSLSAMHASHYAVGLAKALTVSKIIVYHSYENVPVITDVPGIAKAEQRTAFEESVFSLDLIRRDIELMDEGGNIKVETVANDEKLELGLEKMIKKWNAELVVVGTTGKSGLEKFLMGSNTRYLASTCSVPLLIVPKGTTFKRVEKIVFACDYKRVDSTTPIAHIAWWLKSLKAQLLVLNVALKGGLSKVDLLAEQNRIHTILEELEPSYHYRDGNDISEEIAAFAEDEEVDLVITIPNRYEFFEGIFHRSVSKRLTDKTEVPLLVWRET